MSKSGVLSERFHCVLFLRFQRWLEQLHCQQWEGKSVLSILTNLPVFCCSTPPYFRIFIRFWETWIRSWWQWWASPICVENNSYLVRPMSAVDSWICGDSSQRSLAKLRQNTYWYSNIIFTVYVKGSHAMFLWIGCGTLIPQFTFGDLFKLRNVPHSSSISCRLKNVMIFRSTRSNRRGLQVQRKRYPFSYFVEARVTYPSRELPIIVTP